MMRYGTNYWTFIWRQWRQHFWQVTRYIEPKHTN